jgi:transposase-like protein
MAFVSVRCPHCGEQDVVKRGKTSDGKQRYLCTNTHCAANTFMLDYTYQGCLPDVKKKIIDMAMNGSGIRDTARVLNISQSTVINEIKKKNPASSLLTKRP